MTDNPQPLTIGVHDLLVYSLTFSYLMHDFLSMIVMLNHLSLNRPYTYNLYQLFMCNLSLINHSPDIRRLKCGTSVLWSANV